MKNTLLIALFAAMPLMAQDCPQKPECAPVKPCCKMHCPHGPRPELTEEQKAEMKAKFEARKAAFEAKMLEKFDADKDGKLSDAEKEAIKAEFAKRGPKGPRCGKKGPRRPHCGAPCPMGPRPELTEEQKAKFEARKAEMKAKFMEKFDTDKDGKISDAEKEAIKAEFAKRGPKGPRCGKKGPRRPHCGAPCPMGPRPELTEEQKAKFEARKAEMKAKFMEKFDTDKDGKISDAEKEAIKAEFAKRGPKGPRCGKKGPRRPHCGAPCPMGPRPELTEEQKAKFEARKAEMKAKFMEKFDTDKDGKISDAEKEAIKAEFGKRCPKGPRPCCAPKCEQK